MSNLLDIRDLHVHFDTEDGVVRALHGVDIQVKRGETVCLVGESGCGKSVTGHAVLGLTPRNGRIVSGSILFDGNDLLQHDEGRLNRIRGKEIAMIFQDPMNALNPVHSVGAQLKESLVLHQRLDDGAARRRAVQLLEMVGIPAPEMRLKEFPHQLSGGMSQRVMIAMALACRPKLLIADEPTTALDVTIQAQILDLLRQLQAETGMSVLLITHDLGVVAEMAHEVAVMYCGRIVEAGAVADLFARPAHPYTQGLLRSLPRVDRDAETLEPIEGVVPSPFALPAGCSFAPRCRYASTQCSSGSPPLAPGHGRQSVACYHPIGAAA
jgi:peptide/nickel transport system ATP-binding protein/oligopeptide transport system ATP-binding protein